MSPLFCWIGLHSWEPQGWLNEVCFWCGKKRTCLIDYGNAFRGLRK